VDAVFSNCFSIARLIVRFLIGLDIKISLPTLKTIEAAGGWPNLAPPIYFIGLSVPSFRLGGRFRSPTNLHRANKCCSFPPPDRLPANPGIRHALPCAYYDCLSAITKRCK